jgi:7-carboxy-7-deazaguanine synthase (Cx14CxxC type)
MKRSKTYKVKEIYYTIQGEGYYTGRPAVFCRMSGCNLWSGLEKDRNTAICKFCDTDFWGIDGQNGGKYKAEDLAKVIKSLWPTSDTPVFVVITGGEPTLQLDEALVETLHSEGIEIAIETNGTLPLPKGIDWVCVSPKSNSEIVVIKGDELKLVYPQAENDPHQFIHLDFNHFYLQPLDDENQSAHIKKCIDYVQHHPQWRLSLQMHKIIGID